MENFETKCPKVDFSANKFAFFTPSCSSYTYTQEIDGADHHRIAYLDHFNYPDETPEKWNDTYKKIGENFPNTAYVHIYPTILSSYDFDLTVIQYHYFYPYNDWWNNHEGDWQRVDVVIDPSEEKVIGVEYRFHGAHLSYYKDYKSPQGPNPFSSVEPLDHTDFCCVPSANLTDSFVFNPRTDLRLSQGTHLITARLIVGEI